MRPRQEAPVWEQFVTPKRPFRLDCFAPCRQGYVPRQNPDEQTKVTEKAEEIQPQVAKRVCLTNSIRTEEIVVCDFVGDEQSCPFVQTLEANWNTRAELDAINS